MAHAGERMFEATAAAVIAELPNARVVGTLGSAVTVEFTTPAGKTGEVDLVDMSDVFVPEKAEPA